MARSAEIKGIVAVMCDDGSIDLHDGDEVRCIYPWEVPALWALHDEITSQAGRADARVDAQIDGMRLERADNKGE